MKYFLPITLAAVSAITDLSAQFCGNLDMQWLADIPSACNQITMTMQHDLLDRPFLYVANKEGGLKVYDISTVASPVLVKTLPVSLYDGLHVMNLEQDGHYLYLALGNHFTNPQAGGVAVVDVSEPAAASVSDYFVVPNSSSGCGIVKVEGNYAYLGVMRDGLVVMDVSDKGNIQLLSQFVPDINYPVANPNPSFYNSRGMAVKNSIVYLCHDAGGIRVINCTDQSAPVETGRWANPVMYQPLNLSRAYNNAVLDDTLLYVAVDYCGVEVLSVADTGNIKLVGWWNPYNCPGNNWFTSPVHANEIHLEKDCGHIFVSTGKSDLYVLDVSDPAQPDSCGIYGGVDNDIGTWGVGVHEDKIFLSYICNPLPWPFPSDWTAVKILQYNPCTTSTEEGRTDLAVSVFPNPFQHEAVLKSNFDLQHATLTIYNLLGQPIKTRSNLHGRNVTIERPDAGSGLYFYMLKNEGRMWSGGVVVE